MKSRVCMVLGVLAGYMLALTPSFAQKIVNFEGIVVFKKKGETAGVIDSVSMRLYIKGDKFMAEDVNDANQPRIIVDTKKKSIFMITDRTREYMQMPTPPAPPTVPARPPQKTGKTDQMAGHVCEQWLEKTGDTDMELWTSNDLGKLSLPSGTMGVNLISSQNMATFLKNSNMFPLLFVERNKNGREITRLEVVSVEKKNLNEAVFDPPQGYSKMIVPSDVPTPVDLGKKKKK
ncbi:MAG: DUF4412 domain-containing protein [Candidatus Kapaibacterium sp.]|nr:MAG: DUF4412 domain-containing protein [Candidatus Kapabacteria bacterium]